MSANQAPPAGGFSYGPQWLQNSNILGGGARFVGNELLGIDDFRNVWTHGRAGNWDRAGLSALTGATELGLTIAAFNPWSMAGTAGQSGTARLAIAGGRAVLPKVTLRGLGRAAVSPFTSRGRAILAQAGRIGAGRYGQGDEAEAEAELDQPASESPPFSLNFGPGGAAGGGRGGGGGGVGGGYIDGLLPISDYETLLANQIDQIDARSGAYYDALGTTWDTVAKANRAASAKALEMGAEFGEVGRQRWHEAAQGALNVAAARAEAISVMSGGIPQSIGPSGTTDDFVRQAETTGLAEQSLQEGLGQMRSADMDWLAEQSSQQGAGYQSEVRRTQQDLTAMAVANHNNRIIERNMMIAQMKFQAAMQQQSLSAAAAGKGADYTDVYNLAGSLQARGVPGSAAASMLYQTFPEVFGNVGSAEAFFNQIGTTP